MVKINYCIMNITNTWSRLGGFMLKLYLFFSQTRSTIEAELIWRLTPPSSSSERYFANFYREKSS